MSDVSWTDVYPVLSDEMLDIYQAKGTAEEKGKIAKLFAVARVFNPQKSRHLVVISLARNPGSPDGVPAVSEMWDSVDTDGTRWESWFEFHQLLAGAESLRQRRPDVVLRVYLAADLLHLVGILTHAGCEVCLMHETAQSNCQALMWRFLAIGEKDRWITVSHTFFGPEIIHDIERTEQIMSTGLGFWRVPLLVGDESIRREARAYRPVQSVHFGIRGGMPAEDLMQALIWHGARGSMNGCCTEDGGKTMSYPLDGAVWPEDGFDEWFLMTALYPRAAFEGVLTFLIWQRKMLSYWYALDIEHVTWAHPQSEIIISRKMILPDAPWRELPESGGMAVRADTQVIRRRRRRIYQGFKVPPVAEEVLPFTPFDGGLAALLEWTASRVEESWWVDFDENLRMAPSGAELFLDRRFGQADVVVSGSYFLSLTAEMSAWAVAQGLDAAEWKTGAILKVPRLEGRLTLWSTRFSAAFSKALKDGAENLNPDLVLEVWAQLGKAQVMTASARRMGWKAA